MKRVLVVSVEPPWPAHHGGRIRTAKVAEALSQQHDVLVVYPEHGPAAAQAPVRTTGLAWSPPPALRTRLSGRPHLGGYFMASTAGQLSAVAQSFQPDAVYWSHSYLVPWSPPSLRGVAQVVEFANIESRRLRSLVSTASPRQKVARVAEAAKAARWEPRVAREASLCVALSEPDLNVLRGWRANAVLTPNGVDSLPYRPSPVDGYVLALASYDYEPNIAAVRHVVGQVWADAVRQAPQARLVIAGRSSERLRAEFASVPGVSVAGTLDDVSEAYAGAALTVAAATTGGGSQLKLTESLSRGRSVVMSPFAAQGMPIALRGNDACQTAASPAEFAQAIAAALTDPGTRHARERSAIDACRLITWDRVVGELSAAIEGFGSGSVHR